MYVDLNTVSFQETGNYFNMIPKYCQLSTSIISLDQDQELPGLPPTL